MPVFVSKILSRKVAPQLLSGIWGTVMLMLTSWRVTVLLKANFVHT